MLVEPGARLGPFDILSRLGAGGMGEVFRARDSRLGRDVALKVLHGTASSPDQLKRFEQEARSLASLNHPNILVIHEAGLHEGKPYLVSELLEGQSIREALRSGAIPHRKATGYALQVAAGLAAAHAKGIVHRDLKPENLFLLHGGWIKILDFGIAKLQHEPDPNPASAAPPPVQPSNPEAADSAPTQIVGTRQGLVIGTLGYMSPEQVKAGEVDPRSDIFSFGSVFFEMLSGTKPFHRPSQIEVMTAILREEPPELLRLSPQLPAALDRIVQRCLEKSPADRFQSATDLAFALQNVADDRDRGHEATVSSYGALIDEVMGNFESPGPAAATKTSTARAAASNWPGQSVAVLPFVNMSSDRENEFLSDGITEDLITAFSRLPGLRVPARTSSFAFKGKQEDVRAIGEKLRVRHVLEGSLRKAGNRLRITAQLIDVASGFHLWSERYDREMEDVFAIQDEMTRSIVSALELRLGASADTPLVKAPTGSIEAYHLYLKGRECWNRRGAGLLQAVHYFELALLQDPNYALAYPGLADAYSLLGFYGYSAPAEFGPKMRRAIQRGLELDPKLAEIHVSDGWMKSCFDWDFAAAESAYQRAVELNPNYALAFLWRAGNLSWLGRVDEAIAQCRRGVEIDPLSPNAHAQLAWHLNFARRHDEAIAELRKALALDANFGVALWVLGYSFVAQSRFDEAIATLEQAAKISGRPAWVVGMLASAYAKSGRSEPALALLAEVLDPARQPNVRSFFGAQVYAALGKHDLAMEWLHKTFEERDVWLIWLKLNCLFDPLQGDPRFQELAAKIGAGR